MLNINSPISSDLVNNKNVKEKINKQKNNFSNSSKTNSNFLTKEINIFDDSSKTNNIIIYDWDDTFLCTTFFSPFGYFDESIYLNINQDLQIKKLEAIVLSLLTLSTLKGDVYIITNSEPGWVEFSSQKIFPSLLESNILKKISIISARGLYEKHFPRDGKRWKMEAFNDIVNKYNQKLLTNIMSIGDSINEIEAGKKLGLSFQKSFIKTIKLKDFPLVDELINQLNIIRQKFEYIFYLKKNLTIKVERKIPNLKHKKSKSVQI
jgi:hypothetical protein